MDNHTPGPFKTATEDGLPSCVVITESGKCVAYFSGGKIKEGIANAARWVMMANAHEALVEALEGAREELRLIHMKDCGTVYDPTLKAKIEIALKLAGE